MMKRLLLILSIVLVAISLRAQRYGVVAQELCWSTGSVDSSVTRYILASTRSDEVKLLTYLNASGQKVDVSGGGSFSQGHCGCCGGGSGSSGGDGQGLVNAKNGLSLDGDSVILGGILKMNTSIAGMDSFGLDLTNLRYLTLSGTDSLRLITPDLLNAVADVGGVLQLNSSTGCVQYTPYAFPLVIGANGQYMEWDAVGDSLKWTSPYITAVATDSSYRFSVNGSSFSEVLFKNIYTIDDTLTSNRTAHLDGKRLLFRDTGNGHVELISGREVGLFVIKRASAVDSLVFRFDYGQGGDYGLFLDGPLGQREVFSVVDSSFTMGAGFSSFSIDISSIPVDTNTVPTLLTIDPVTERVHRVSSTSLPGSSGGTSLSVLDTTFTSNYIASTDSVINRLTSVTENNDIVIELPTPSANTVGLSYTVNQIDRNNDGLGFTLVQVDGVDYDFYCSGDTLQFVSFTPDLDESFSFQTIYLDGKHRWLATKLQSDKTFEVASISEIQTRSFNNDDRVIVKASDGKRSYSYRVKAAAPSGYAEDTVAVVQAASSNYAVVEPLNGIIDLSWFTSGIDTVDDTEYLRKMGSFLRYSEAHSVYIPKGDWYINHNLANYDPNISIYGNLIGAGRDSCIIKTDSITAIQSGESKIIRMRNKGSRISGIGFDVLGDPTFSNGNDHLTVISLEEEGIIVEYNHLIRFTLGSGNTAGNTYISQFTAQNAFSFSTTTLDTLFPGSSVSAKVADIQWFTKNQPVVIYDNATGNSDTTYIENRFISSDSLTLAVITDTIPAGAVLKSPGFGQSQTIIKDNILENIMYGCALRIVSQQVWIDQNIFRNNGTNTTHHDLYNQSGIQNITNNWFEGGSGYGVSDGNKQEYRFSGGRTITGNTFWNKDLGIQIVSQSHPVTHYSTGLPVSFYGNRVQNGGEVIANNHFHNTPGLKSTTALQLADAFGSIDPNSPLEGNASLIYSNNTHIGRVKIGTGSSYFDLTFEGNIFELNDTSNIENALIEFPDSAVVVNNRFVARGPDHFELSGADLIVDNLVFHQRAILTANEENVSFSNATVKNSRFTVDTVLSLAQTISGEMITISGGRWIDNFFEVKSSEVRNIINVEASRYMPDLLGNEFVRTGLALGNGVKHDEKIKGAIIRNNPGMKIWGRGQYGYPFAGSPQTEASGNLIFAEAHTITTIDPQGGDLIVVNSDSTYSIATYQTDNITGVLMTGARLDSVYAYSTLYEGQIIHINTVGAATVGDYLVIDTTTAGKLKSQGLTKPSGQNLIAQAIEDVTEWDSGTSYMVGDIVEYQNRNYICTYANTNQTPITTQFSGDPYWDGHPLKVQVIEIGISEERIRNITNPQGGTNTIQAALDSLDQHIDDLEAALLPTTQGTAITTVGAGTTLVITHNLGQAPTYISITPGGDIGDWYINSVNSTTITLNYTSTATTTANSVNIYWQVE